MHYIYLILLHLYHSLSEDSISRTVWVCGNKDCWMYHGSFSLFFSLQLSLCLLQSMRLTLSYSCSKPVSHPFIIRVTPSYTVTKPCLPDKGPTPWALVALNNSKLYTRLSPSMPSEHCISRGWNSVWSRAGPQVVVTGNPQWSCPTQCFHAKTNTPWLRYADTFYIATFISYPKTLVT